MAPRSGDFSAARVMRYRTVQPATDARILARNLGIRHARGEIVVLEREAAVPQRAVHPRGERVEGIGERLVDVGLGMGEGDAALLGRHREMEHARLIQATARELFAQINLPRAMEREFAAQWLDWASTLHDIGRDIAHSGYHKHGAYILDNADLPGFSRPDQQVLALLVRAHRRKFPMRLFRDLPPLLEESVKQLALILRTAVLVHRSRVLTVAPRIRIRIQPGSLSLGFPPGWLDAHPLTVADLEQEASFLSLVDINLTFA